MGFTRNRFFDKCSNESHGGQVSNLNLHIQDLTPLASRLAQALKLIGYTNSALSGLQVPGRAVPPEWAGVSRLEG